jgi:hypothetical protein
METLSSKAGQKRRTRQGIIKPSTLFYAFLGLVSSFGEGHIVVNSRHPLDSRVSL